MQEKEVWERRVFNEDKKQKGLQKNIFASIYQLEECIYTCVCVCLEAHHSVVMCDLMEIQTALGVCKRANAQTVGGMELFH